ncbi:MAG: hypothetical protein R8M45_03785 [Ghiorsea sp.]
MSNFTKVGTRVFDSAFGTGSVTQVNSDEEFGILVDFDYADDELYTEKGQYQLDGAIILELI